MNANRRIALLMTGIVGIGVYSAVPAQAVAQTAVQAYATAAPATPPAQICGNASVLTGPATAPTGAVTVPKGDNTGFAFGTPGATYWFEPGEHTFGTGLYSKIMPGEGATFIGGPGAILDGKNLNLYAFESGAKNVKIRYLTIRNFGTGKSNGDEGVVNHGIADGWVVEHNTIENNDGAGIMLGSDSVTAYNCLKDNGQYGFSMWKAAVEGDSSIKNLVLDHNEIAGNNTDDWEAMKPGCGCTGGGKFWDVNGAKVTANWVHDNKSVGLWADTNNIDFLFEGNYIDHNDDEGLFYEISYNATIRNNTFKRNAWVKGRRNAGSPAPAIYLSESGGEARLASAVSGSTKLRVTDNVFEDNFSGVSIFESANRFCNSYGNTSTNYCTPLVAPTKIVRSEPATDYPDPYSWTHPCYTEVKAKVEPYVTDCRWHAKDIQVTNNEFHFNPANVPCLKNDGTQESPFCGANALIASGANNISWAPWTVGDIQNQVMFNAGNLFANNNYYGPWKFAKGYGETINWDTWRAAPFNQDQGSTTDQVPAKVPNVIDPDTATLEGTGTGHWGNWFSAALSQSATEAHSGTHSLAIKAEGGSWGVTAADYPGFAITSGAKTVRLWAKSDGTGVQPTLTLTWFNVNQQTLQTDTVKLPVLTGSWQEVTATFTAPAGTVNVWAQLTSPAPTGSTVYVDDVSIGDTP